MEPFFIYILKSTSILIIFFLIYKFLLQKETFFKLNRHYLLGGILASLLLPFIVLTSYVYIDPLPIQNYAYTELSTTINEISVTEATSPFNWYGFLFNVYILGVALVSIRFVIQLISLYRIIAKGNVSYYGTFKLIEIDEDISPFSFFNFIVFNPSSISEQDLAIILNHEKAHSKQLHSIDIILSQLLVIFQWFNPMVWFYKKTIQQNLEFLADKAAISQVESKKNYQRTLLKVSIAPYYASITNNFYNSLIKKRIIMLNQKSSKSKNLWKYGLILPVLALFVMSFNTKTIEVIKDDIMSEKTEASIPATQLVFSEEPLIVETPEKTNVTSETTTQEETEKVDIKSEPIVTNVNTSANISINDVIAKITKNTTKEELDTIERDLKAKGMDFKYSNLDFNSDNEIVSIKISYKDSNGGNSGSYHVNGDDDEPINTIYIYNTEKGGIGLGNSPDGKEHKEHMIAHKEKMREHKEKMYEHKQRMREHNEQIKEEHEERLEEHRTRMEERKEKMEEEHEVRLEEMKERQEEMHEERQERLEEHQSRMEERRAKLLEKREKRRLKEDTNTFVIDVDNNGSNVSIESSNGKTPLFIVDDVEQSEIYVKQLDTDDIASMNVYKGKSAKVYGSKAKDGVVVIVTKGGQSNSTVYRTTEGSDKMYFIEKTTSDQLLNSYREKLKKQGVDLKISGVKRNKNGEITRIKIRLDDNNGSKSSSTYDTSPNTIPTIMVGKKGDKITITSSKKQ